LPIEINEQKNDAPPPPPPAPTGGIGLATWNTQAQFKDIKVSSGDQVLFQSDFSQNTSGWRARDGDWSAADGALTQTSDAANCRITTGNPAWTDYTYTLKARKTGGQEGFFVLFHARGRNDFIWWNLGGWGDTRTQLEKIADDENLALGASAPVTIDVNRWYDVRIELHGTDIKCYLDDKLITEATDTPPAPLPAIYATASRADASGQVILKVVNVSSSPQNLQINLQGAADVSKDAHLILLTGQPGDMNSIAEPTKVAPQESDLHDAAATFTHEFPAYSVSVLKLAAK
jgi:alpha-L-arabinofuranosidase